LYDDSKKSIVVPDKKEPPYLTENDEVDTVRLDYKYVEEKRTEKK
jgi:hypothetical protein